MILIIPFDSTITMTLLTINDYISSLRQHIEEVKLLAQYNTLLSPSPAQLKEYCLSLCNSDHLSIIDRDILSVFLKCENKGLPDIKKQLQKIDIDRFKPIQYFINGKTMTPKSQTVIEVIAILYNFELRPLGKFRSKGVQGSIEFLKNEKKYISVLEYDEELDLNDQIEELQRIYNVVMTRQLKILSLLKETMPQKYTCGFEDL